MEFHTQDKWKVDPVDTGDCKYLLPAQKCQLRLNWIGLTSRLNQKEQCKPEGRAEKDKVEHKENLKEVAFPGP